MYENNEDKYIFEKLTKERDTFLKKRNSQISQISDISDKLEGCNIKITSKDRKYKVREYEVKIYKK